MMRALVVAGCLSLAACGANSGGTGAPRDLAGTTGADDLGAVETVDGGCGLVTCASAGASCGLIGDGCGAALDCGQCPAGTTCGGGGMPNVCGGVACVPRTCQSVGADCGPVADGCGGLLHCGKCPTGQSCGGGGKVNVCGAGGGSSDGGVCTPRTCAQLGFDCGPAGDGCGGMLDCGATCPQGKACGAGGKPSVCGSVGGCVPRSCAQQQFNCGMAGDGCGNVIQCGSCSGADVCGGAGLANVCGNVPPMMTCVNLCPKQMKCQGAITTTISGTVYAPTDPTRGYGMPDPLYNALVYVPNAQVMPFPAGASCDQCSAQASGSPLVTATTGPDGTFVLTNAPCGTNIPVVIQLGRWRRQITIPSVACCQDNKLTADQSRLPRNQSEGDIPLIAVVTGSADPIECVLPKIGIDTSEFTNPSGKGRVRFYQANGATLNGQTPAESTLWSNPAELAKYDAVIFDCEGSPYDELAGNQKNVIDYTNMGGRVFASHYSYVWLYNDAPFSSTASWNVDQMSLPADSQGFPALIDTTFKKGMDFSRWLNFVGASPQPGQIDVFAVRKDFDAVLPPSQRWLYVDPNNDPGPACCGWSGDHPLEYTFNTPVNAMPQNQCGRVLFSDFHVNTGGSGSGTFPAECNGASPMTAQEKVLEFMLFDLTSCIAPDMPGKPMCTPRDCAAQKATCGAVGDGCGNIIQCGTCPSGQTCGGGGVPNQCGGSACTPTTCAAQGLSCGPAGDGCGGPLDCGKCPMGQTCGGGGKPGQCGAGSCMPLTCAAQGLSCGPAGDGCGLMIDCGPCPAGETCGGGGVLGKCGAGCKPLTCAQVGATCGLIGDGCGGVVDCGACPTGKTCGGGGVANQCSGIG